MNARSDLIIYGCGGHARSVIDILLSGDRKFAIKIVDENALENEMIYGFPILKECSTLKVPYFIAIGNNYSRAKVAVDKDISFLVSVISNLSYIGRRASISQGVFVGNYVHIGPESFIGANTIINNGAIVDHEVEIGSYCHIGPNATVSGRSKVGDFVFLGVGATIIDSVAVCSGVTIGAGAIVTKNIDSPGTYVGCPARKIK